MKYIFVLPALLYISCSNPLPPSVALPVKTDTTYIFKDSINIAAPGKYKVEVYRFVVNDSISEAAVLFFQKQDTGWFNISSFRTEQWTDDLSVEIKDFNNDGLKDLTYVKGMVQEGVIESCIFSCLNL